MSLSAAATMGSGAGGLGGDGAAMRLDFGAGLRLKFGQERLSNFGKETETRSKLGGEKRSKLGKEKFGRELAVAAPRIASAASDTMVTVTRLEAPCGAAPGCLSPCASFSGVSATCIPHEPDQSQHSPRRQSSNEKSHRGDNPATTRAMAQPN